MPRLTLRRLALAAFLAAPLWAAGLLTAVALDWLKVAGALFLAVASLILAALGVLGVGLRRVQLSVRQGLREIRAQSDLLRKRQDNWESGFRQSLAAFGQLVEDVRGSFGEDRAQLLALLHLSREQVEGVGKRISDLQERIAALEASAQDLQSQVVMPVIRAIEKASDVQTRQHKRLYTTIDARSGLGDLVTPRAPMPLLGGWALDADVMHMVMTLLWTHRPGLIVECGSGSSTIWLGYIVERFGKGRVIALEHDERYLATSRDLIRAHSLEDTVEVRHAPLESWSDLTFGGTYQWYTSKALEDLEDIELLLVDGPPSATGPLARYPAVPLLLPRCATHAVIVLDDTGRTDEQVISDRWLTAFPELERSVYGTNAAHIFRRRSVNLGDRKAP